MNASLLFVTHDDVGKALLNAATNILGSLPLAAEAYAITANCQPGESIKEIELKIQQLDKGGGVLILTDLYGATPCNIAMRTLETEHVAVVSGVNLPMLVRLLNYPALDLAALVEKAKTGGQEGIIGYA